MDAIHFLGEIKQGFVRDPGLANLLLDAFFQQAVQGRQAAWRRVVAAAVQLGNPGPCLGGVTSASGGRR